ncbi:hypothetical protein LZ009_00510 [Ramlibacter sp. XY19]|uniref:hypothetical protein n=1 Tax=Ramlibacter paludis TaxID=2908000 RepID=UPI0023DB375A|nr:hypothetical protein [Ramlibacter paludis]MCG2591259.1 hypothetical protein [Ramlibacter paludis]
MQDDDDRTASLMTPAKLAQLKVRPKPAASPAAWLDQLAADAGSGHVRRLVDLRKQLEGQVAEARFDAVRGALDALAAQAGQLDFAQLQPKGWLARATGKGKEQAAEFLAQYDRTRKCGEDLQDDVKALQRALVTQGTAVERSLLEVEVELKAIEKIIDQGARWLQDMRNQLKAREAAGGDEAARQSMQEDEARCELLVARLKQLRGASSAAQQALEQCRQQAGRRSALLERLQQALETEWKTWQRHLTAVAREAKAGGSAAPEGTEVARSADQALKQCALQAAEDCGALQAQEQALVAELVALQEPLRAAA